MPRQRTKREPAVSPVAPPSIDLRGTTSAAAYERILESLAEGRITISEALKLGNLVEIGISVRDAEIFRQKLASLEAGQKAQHVALRTLAPAPPARRAVVEMTEPGPGTSPAPWGAAP